MKILSLFGIYILASYGAWSLAIPPHYASVFWPAAGVALGFVFLYGWRVLPGVFLGAFASVFLSPLGNDFNFAGVLLASGIASGAMLQAFIGSFLVKRFIRENTRLQNLRSIFLFCTFGALSCFVAPTIALGTFFVLGKIDLSGVVRFWEAWFIGDVLGVILFAPLVVLVLNYQNVSYFRRLAVIVPITLLFLVFVGFFLNVKSRDFVDKQDYFNGDVEMVKREIQSKFESYYASIIAVQSFYNASPRINQTDFAHFVDYILSQNTGVRALAWAPHILRDDKERFLEEGRALHGDGFNIRDISTTQSSSNLDADFYMPLYFVEPYERAKSVIGADLWSSATRRKALGKAKEHGVVTATEPIALVDVDEREDLGFIIVAPVFDVPSQGGNNDHNPFRGVVVGAFQYSGAVDLLMNAWRDQGVELIIKAQHDDDMSVVYHSQAVIPENDFVEGFVVDVPYVFAGQQWLLRFYMNPTYYNQNLNFTIWYALVIGLVFLSFTSIFLLALTGQSAAMAALVDEKTAELSHKNRFLNVVMDTVPDMIFVKDSDFNVVQANQSFFDKFAPEVRDGLIGTRGLEQFPKDEQEIYLINDKKALADGVSETQEQNTDYQGTVRTLETRKQRFYDENDEAFILGYARDVTDLLNTQTKLETILDTTADGLITIDEQGLIETYNKACESIFGYSAECVIGKNIDILIPDYQVSSAETQERCELEAKRKDGAVFPVDISIAEVKLGYRKIFSGVIRDISTRKKAEELARQITQIFSSAIIEFYIFDAQTMEFVFVNNGAINNMGYSEEELLGHRPSDFVEEYTDEVFSTMAGQLMSGEKERVDFDMRHMRKDGSYYDVAANLQLTTFNGRPAFIASMVDITDRNKVTQELKRSNKELESFAYVTSHDLKAPLRHVSMSASFFKEQYADKLDGDAKGLLDVMINGANRMQSMIESLLGYSRVGRDGEELKEVDLSGVLSAVEENLADDMAENQGVIHVGDMPNVTADRYLMIQLFQNLIQNALKYRKVDEPPIVTIVCEEERGCYKISVSDNGIGIDPAYSEKVFQIFQRLHRDNEFGGVGIGLSICQRIVEFHGGSIALDTDYSGGVKIDFTLPKTKY